MEARPRDAEAQHYFGLLLCQTGRVEAGLGHIERSVALNPDAAEFRNNLATVLKENGRADDAIEHFRAALALDPSYIQCYSNLGAVLGDRGDIDEAIGLLERAVALDPKHAEARSNLGNFLNERDEVASALAHLEKAVALNPKLAAAHSNLANVLCRMWRPDAAADHYRRAIALDPRAAAFRNNFATLLFRQNLFDKAVEQYRAAVELDDRRADFHANYAMTLNRIGRRGDALARIETAERLDPADAKVHERAGQILNELGRSGDAVASFDRAAALAPDDPIIASSRLYIMLHNDELSARPQELAAAFGDWGTRFGAAQAADHGNDPDPGRRLRVGYVSPDFRGHTVAYYIEPLFAHHDRAAIEIFAYAEVTAEGDGTTRFRELADHWRITAGLDDDALAQAIREDNIDILVDLAGHTGNNRLPVFAHRPAPVQIAHMIGLMQTTGVAAIDHALGDPWVAPEGAEDQFAETIHRLDRPFISFQPDPGWPDLTPLPAAAAGHVTFASFNKPNRITPATAALWAGVLEAVPGSRLLLKHPDYREDIVADRVRALFAEPGLADRLALRPVTTGWANEMDVYAEVDIALDTWPMCGGSTSVIALWMGLPLVTLATRAVHTRFGRMLTACAGLEDLTAAADEDEFLARATGLAGDLDRLAELRAGLRERMLASPLLDHQGLARATEDAYRAMWRKWCEAQSASEPQNEAEAQRR